MLLPIHFQQVETNHTNLNSGLTIPPLSVDMPQPQHAHTHGTRVCLPMIYFGCLAQCTWLFCTHMLLTCSPWKAGLCWFSIGIPNCSWVCVCGPCCWCMHAPTERVRVLKGVLNSSCSLTRTYVPHRRLLPTGEFPILHLHLKYREYFRSQVNVCIDWTMVPLEENTCVIFPALPCSAYVSPFICSKQASHYVTKGDSPECSGAAHLLPAFPWLAVQLGTKSSQGFLQG